MRPVSHFHVVIPIFDTRMILFESLISCIYMSVYKIYSPKERIDITLENGKVLEKWIIGVF